MRRIIINPSGDEHKDIIQDMVIDCVLGFFGLLGLFLSTGCVLRYLIGTPLLNPMNFLLVLLGAVTLATMIRIHREIAMPGEGCFWMTRRSVVGTLFHGLVAAYTLFLMAVAFDIAFFRRVPGWVYNFVTKLL
jgi:hypothetical protein